MTVSIVIPVLNKVEFTRQCLDRIWRNTGDVDYEVIVVDNGSKDGTEEWCAGVVTDGRPVRYHRNSSNLGFAKANNIGARHSRREHLLFLNNDTLVQPGWLTEMLRVRRADSAVGVVGIKQLFPYTNVIYHTGIVFAPDGTPQHLYPHLDASLPHVNIEREYQAVTGACLLIDRLLFEDCGGFDEGYLNGYEDVDLCLAVRQRGRKVVCCTGAYIYHYGQISEGRTADDDRNAERFRKKWADRLRTDRDDYLVRDRAQQARAPRPTSSPVRKLAEDCVYFADDLGQGSALTWINAELALSLHARGVPVFVNGDQFSPTLPASTRDRLKPMAVSGKPVGGVQIKWSHYWPQHLNLELAGDFNLEFFVINYLFGRPGSQPWDRWLQCLKQNHYDKLPLSEFCRSVLLQLAVPDEGCHVLHPGYSREVLEVETPRRSSATFRFLTVTNSHDLARYGTLSVIEAYRKAFRPDDDVLLTIKDYGASSGDTTIRDQLAHRAQGARVEYSSEFTTKHELMRLYKSSDAFVSAHRGEGFGMKILDAAACGLPVISPLFGGPTAYCSPETCYPVEFELVPMGECLDSRSLSITNQPLWAEPSVESLARQMRSVCDNREAGRAVGARARTAALERFSWDRSAGRLMEIAETLRARRTHAPRARSEAPASPVERSPYWLGVRVSVVVPTHNRKEKLIACLDCLAHQSVLPQEFEVVVVDDGSTDGTNEAVAAQSVPFQMKYFRQEAGGPGAARNLGIDMASGELVLFIGDDILADERLLEEHLLAHARQSDPGLAVLGHIDWPEAMPQNAVMKYVTGDAMLQFAYGLIPGLPRLDHRFFYTSNISLKRQFLVDAADAGVRFDSCFRHAAFEDSELAFRLTPRGLKIVYAEGALARHDHSLDLDDFSARELRAGEMAVVFYRKHPSEDEQLQVRWIADLVGQIDALLRQPEFLGQIETFDRQSDALLRALAGSLEGLLAIERQLGEGDGGTLSSDRLRLALNNTLRAIFDVARTRGKIKEWFGVVEDPAPVRAAQALASVRRKIEFLTAGPDGFGAPGGQSPFDGRLIASLSTRIAALEGDRSAGHVGPAAARVKRVLRRLVSNPVIVHRLIRLDRLVQAHLQTPARQPWLEQYRRLRGRVRRVWA